MKFTCQVEIDLALSKVIPLYENVDYLKEWQSGFVSFEHLSGEAGKPGAKSKIRFKHNNREMELIETVVKNDLPEEFTAIFEHEHMVNTMTSHFESIDEHNTLFQMHFEYTKFIGFMPKLMAFLMPGMFKKQSQKWLDQFKNFAENHEKG